MRHSAEKTLQGRLRLTLSTAWSSPKSGATTLEANAICSSNAPPPLFSHTGKDGTQSRRKGRRVALAHHD